ncbi:phospholipase D/Transphosphatidylase [[Leptolyngbya] sp. PCC 7376]|uniref:phospholipase D-like domain-containing protein n=1 Tax=[Leptolyngbya] sp. PCC 7376 TaxID=111781 RepID=UPI00029F4306|nr:phospholipase D-like domain-containing protein [[Leptolyngbya] sp. PCC 7376]AFY39223.1 phospholipase D/Transphosphatidylase [[Leptolyngbya] sp. PCC 7376]
MFLSKTSWGDRLRKCVSFFAGAALLVGCSSKDQRPDALSQDEFIQVYFNHLEAKGVDYKEPYRDIFRAGDNLEAVLVAEITAATQSIDIAIQEINLPLVAEAIAQKKAEGLNVRVIVENNYRRPWVAIDENELLKFDEQEQRKYQEFVALADDDKDGFLSDEEKEKYDAIAILENAGVPILDDTADGTKGSGLMHHKFMVIDGRKIVTGSANWTLSGIHGDFANLDTRGNLNHLLVIEDGAIAAEFTKEFEEMWTNRNFGVQKIQDSPKTFTVGNSQVTLQFSPFSSSQPWENTSNGLIGQTLSQADKSINLALFVFAEQDIANILETESQEGTTIQALIDSSFAFRDYSDGLDMLGVNIKEKCDPFNRPWRSPIQSVGTPKLPQGDKLHHKFAVLDEYTVITGSHNWSASANSQNDETLLVVQNPQIAQHFQREFDRLYSDSYLGIPPFIAEKQKSIPADCIPASSRGIVNINTATAVELETLPGIGESLAQKIIENRPYKNSNDLQRVPGIGEKKVATLEGKITW